MRKIVIAFAIMMTLSGGTVSIMKWLKVGPFADETDTEAAAAKPEPSRFIDMDPLIVTVFPGNRSAVVYQIQIKLETLGDDNAIELQRRLPRVTDAFIRDLHAFAPRLLKEQGRLDVYILKQRLKLIADRTLQPGIVNDVLIQSVAGGP